MKKFIKDVREFYKPYYDKGDKAHTIAHADEVCKLALKMNNGEYKEKLVVLSAYIHDIFNSKDRAKHHKLAYKYVLAAEDKFLKELNKKELELVAYATLQHRASYKGKFFSKLSEILSSADRGAPKFEPIVIRCMQFNNEDIDGVVDHVKDKYAKSGYAKYPKLYIDYFGKEFDEFQERAKNITKEQVIEVWSSKN